MNRKTRNGLIAALATASAFAFIAWTSGYDFDHRGENVGVATMLIMMISAGAFAAVYGETKEGP